MLATNLHSCCDIRAMNHGDESCLAGYRLSDVIGVNQSGVRIAGHACLLDTPLIDQRVERAKHRIMVHPGGDHVRLWFLIQQRLQYPVDPQVQGIGGVERKNDLLGFGGVRAYESAQTDATFEHQLAGFAGFAISTTSGTGAQLVGVAHHGVNDSRRLGKARGGVIQI